MISGNAACRSCGPYGNPACPFPRNAPSQLPKSPSSRPRSQPSSSLLHRMPVRAMPRLLLNVKKSKWNLRNCADVLPCCRARVERRRGLRQAPHESKPRTSITRIKFSSPCRGSQLRCGPAFAPISASDASRTNVSRCRSRSAFTCAPIARGVVPVVSHGDDAEAGLPYMAMQRACSLVRKAWNRLSGQDASRSAPPPAVPAQDGGKPMHRHVEHNSNERRLRR